MGTIGQLVSAHQFKFRGSPHPLPLDIEPVLIYHPHRITGWINILGQVRYALLIKFVFR